MASRRSLVFLVLGAALLLVAALVGVLALTSTPAEDAGGGPFIARPSDPTPGPVLPSPTEADAVQSVQVPRPTGAVLVGPSVIVARVIDEETLRPITVFTVKPMPHDDRTALSRLTETPGHPEAVRAVAGVFRLERTRGRWDVLVQADGYLPGELADVEIPRPDSRPLELRLSHGPSITGMVFDDTNLGVKDVPVFLRVDKLAGNEPPPRVCVARTDVEGRFRFSPLPPGLYSVSAIEPDSTDRVNNIGIDHGTAEVAVYVAPRHQVVLSLRDVESRPVSGAEVELRSPNAIAVGRSNASGNAQIRFVKPGRYEVRITREGYVEVKDTLDLTGLAAESVHWYTLQSSP